MDKELQTLYSTQFSLELLGETNHPIDGTSALASSIYRITNFTHNVNAFGGGSVNISVDDCVASLKGIDTLLALPSFTLSINLTNSRGRVVAKRLLHKCKIMAINFSNSERCMATRPSTTEMVLSFTGLTTSYPIQEE